jgi:hypothetical protein
VLQKCQKNVVRAKWTSRLECLCTYVTFSSDEKKSLTNYFDGALVFKPFVANSWDIYVNMENLPVQTFVLTWSKCILVTLPTFLLCLQLCVEEIIFTFFLLSDILYLHEFWTLKFKFIQKFALVTKLTALFNASQLCSYLF